MNHINPIRKYKHYRPTNEIKSFDYILENKKPCVLWLRASRTDNSESIKYQKKYIMIKLEKHGIKPIEKFEEVCSGKLPWVNELLNASDYAKKRGACLLAVSPSRYLRNARYSYKKNYLAPTQREWQELCEKINSVQLVTLCDPAVSPSDERSHQTKMGIQGRGVTGGRPYKSKKKRREAKMQIAFSLAIEKGYSAGKIAKLSGVPRSTVRNWLKSEKRWAEFCISSFEK